MILPEYTKKLYVTNPDIFFKIDRLYGVNQAAGNAYTGDCVK